MAVLDGKLYVFSGSDHTGVQPDKGERYDPDTNTWESMPECSCANIFLDVEFEIPYCGATGYGQSAAVLDGKVWVTGGFGGIPTLNGELPYMHEKECNCEDNLYKNWEEETDHIHPCENGCDRVFGPDLPFVQVFDPWCPVQPDDMFTPTPSWQQKGLLNIARCFHATVVLNGEMYVVGGVHDEVDEESGVVRSRGSHDETTVEKYDRKNDRWTIVPGMEISKGRMVICAAVHKI